MDYVYYQTAVSGKTGVVNLSVNGPRYPIGNFGGFQNSTPLVMQNVVTPGFIGYYNSWGNGAPWGGIVPYFYPGSLIVQSAGNDGVDACTAAYNAPSTSDGIIVAGGLDRFGYQVTNGYINNFTATSPASVSPGVLIFTGSQVGSNHGECVDMWAPTQEIVSTWSYNSYRTLSGTSMAAPHIAGFAAALLERNPNTSWTAPSLETAIRTHLVYTNGGKLMPRF